MTGFDKYIAEATDPALRKRIEIEKQMAEALVDTCLERGFVISVYDGEEWAIKRSGDKAAIMAELFATDDDQVVIRRKEDGRHLGWFHLVYGNCGYDVVSDHSDNEVCNEIWEKVLRPLSDKLEAA
ncbi:hypothetical protein [Mesorhizobium sp. WSM2239]|uniref:Uncharacterized protein n=2 Tax=unclassified Mesorhizobium TaxID=325217 RepID=A0AAU8DH24_9HYPH